MNKLTPQTRDVYALLLADYNMGMKLSKMEYCGELLDKGIVVEENGELWFLKKKRKSRKSGLQI